VYDKEDKSEGSEGGEDEESTEEDEQTTDEESTDEESSEDGTKGYNRPSAKKPKVVKLTPSKITIVERFKAGSEDEKRDKALAARAILKKLGFDYNTGWRYASFDGEA